jgi:hypothetical protein
MEQALSDSRRVQNDKVLLIGRGAKRPTAHTTPFSTAKRVAALRELTWSLP